MSNRISIALAILFFTWSVLNTSGVSARDGAETKKASDGPITDEPQLACRLGALTVEQRKRHAEIRKALVSGVQEVKELTDGYAFRFEPETSWISLLSEFMSLERLCCPFFDFVLEVGNQEKPVWLRMTGGAGVKQFLKTQFHL